MAEAGGAARQPTSESAPLVSGEQQDQDADARGVPKRLISTCAQSTVTGTAVGVAREDSAADEEGGVDAQPNAEPAGLCAGRWYSKIPTCSEFRNELRLENLGFDNKTTHGTIVDPNAAFGVNLFCGQNFVGTVVARCAFSVIMIAIWVWSQLDFVSERVGSNDISYGYWWIYFTHWSLTLQVIYHVLSIVVAIRARNPDGDGPSTNISAIAKISWLMQAVCLPATAFTFIMGPGVLGLIAEGIQLPPGPLAWSTHGVNFGIMIGTS